MVSSGECLQTLEIGRALFNISFYTTGSCLHTEMGTIAVDASSALNDTECYGSSKSSISRRGFKFRWSMDNT
jgi:hypothetical protein